ncbi:restriction endonuclease subunit S [Bacteroides fragilis]|nr:restriction endonuclease subunit S [Bacteroides fragilis]MCE8691610.1 restriction endonuclease subunit S [Bacteroides fragilis]MCE9315745.1 restriction endonuclease subunit S [Bacteroides fragilis]RHH64754.1 restriction endonuclease subunit S [Bacteroides fragilis]
MRFPEFTEEWRSHFLTDFMSFKNGMNPDAKRFGRGTKFISVMDILNNQFICYDNIRASVEVMDGDIDTYGVNYGDILFQRSSETLEDVGQANVYLDSKPAIFGGFVIRGKSKGNYNPLFFRYLLASPTARKRIIVKGAGAQHFNIGQDGLSKVSLDIPCMQEQKKIGELLQCIDARIATQNKIIDRLQSLIKGLTDTLLENPLWQKTYLRSFMQFYSTNSLSWGQLSYEEGEIRNLHYGLIHSFQTSEIDTDSLPRILPTNVPKQYTLCQAGDVAFADASEDTNEIGKAVEFIRTHKASVICGLHTIHGRDIKCKTLLGFKRVAFNSHYFHDQIKRLAQGTKVFSITSSNLSSCYIYIPDIVMQKSIVVLFKAYEEQLITNKRLLEQYEKQKRYLLQQMFI